MDQLTARGICVPLQRSTLAANLGPPDQSRDDDTNHRTHSLVEKGDRRGPPT